MWRNSGTSSRESGRMTKGDALLSAQTTLPPEQAKQQNQAYHQKQKRKLELLRPTSESISVWPTKVRKALESGLLEPERGPMAVEGEHLQEVKEAYLRTRELINTGTNPFNPRLLEEVPDCLLNMKFMEYQEEPSTGASCPDMAGSSCGGFHFHGPHHEGDCQRAGTWLRRSKVGHDPCDVGLPQRRGQSLRRPVDYCSWPPYAARLGLQEGGQPGSPGPGTSHTPLQHEDSMGRPDGVHGGRDPHPCGTEEASPH